MTSKAKILIVDDDEGLALTLAATLEEYEVTVFSNAIDALELLVRAELDTRRPAEAATPFDLVICDLVMPLMTGPELYESLAQLDPLRKRFVFMSGGNVPDAVLEFLAAKQPVLWKKPFGLEVQEWVRSQLADQVAQADAFH